MKTGIMNNTSTFAIAILALSLFGTTIGNAAPGDLDVTFGNGGKVIAIGIEGISDIAIQPDGKIVAVGGDRIVRYNANGSLDSSFGGSGIVIIQLGNGISIFANAVAVQADGKIVVAAESEDVLGGSVWNSELFRYNPNGTLDTTFNDTGRIYGSGGGDSVAIQTDGKIVVGGGEFISSVFRYHSNGSLDTSFNDTGGVIIPNSHASSVAVQPDGKIVVGGSSREQTSPYSYFYTIFRFNADGTPDASFGDAGRVSSRLGPDIWSHASKLAIQSDGKIVTKLAGEIENTGDLDPPDYVYPFTRIARHNPNGSLDPTFRNHLYESFLDRIPGDLAIQPDGKIVTSSTWMSDFAVRRYNPYGLTDTTFNDVGFVTTHFGTQDEAIAVAIQPDGKIIAAGISRTFQPDGSIISQVALARHEGGSTARTRSDFDGDGRADLSVFRPSDRTWYLNQSTNGFSATQFGFATDILTPADYDGDGRTDISVYRDGVWYWLKSSDNSFKGRQFGIASDIPVPANYYTGGDGGSELAVYRGGTWWILNLSNNQVNAIQFGLASDKPIAADYDGDGRADPAVYRNGEWHLLRSTEGYGVVYWGLATDKPVPADYDSDGRTDVAVYRDGTWFTLQSINGFAAFQFGIASDIPAPADYDGDGRADVAVFRDGVWYLQQSTSGFAAQHFGLTNDKPVSGYYLP